MSLFWQVSIYMVVTLIVTVLFAISQQQLFKVSRIKILNAEHADRAPLILPQLAPAISFLLVILLIQGQGVSINFDLNRAIALKSVVAVVIPLILAFAIFFVSKFLGMKPRLTGITLPAVALAITTIAIGALGEEIGWRGFLQPLLEKGSSALVASVVVGLLWGLWHVGHYKNGLLYMTAFLLFTISASIIIAWIYSDTGFNILIPMLFHTSVNFCFFKLFRHSLADYKFMAVTAGVWLIPAICIVFATGKI